MNILQIFPFIFVLAFTGRLAQGKVSVRFSPVPADEYGVDDEISDRLGQAQKSIDIAMYSFSNDRLRKKLIELARPVSNGGQGLKIRLVYRLVHGNPNHSGNKTYLAWINELERGGVDVRFFANSNGQGVDMHHKFALIDGPQTEDDIFNGQASRSVLLTGSGNWSSGSSSTYSEDFLVFENEPKRVNAFGDQFNFLWLHAKDYEVEGGPHFESGVEINSPEHDRSSEFYEEPEVRGEVFTSENFLVANNGIFSIFSSLVELEGGAAGRKIRHAILSAEKEIQISHNYFNRKDVATALIQRLGEINITVVVDMKVLGGSLSKNVKDFEAAGGNVTYVTYPYKSHLMHAKYIVIDRKKVITGSFNLSRPSELDTLENLIELDDKNIAWRYRRHHKKLRNFGRGHFRSMDQAFSARLNALENVINPNDGQDKETCKISIMSLTREQAYKIHDAIISFCKKNYGLGIKK